MYRVNPLPRKVLITVDEVVAMGPTSNDPDPRMILTAIQIAEERFLKPALCRDLYYDIRNQKNVLITSDNIGDLKLKFPPSSNLEIGKYVNASELLSTGYLELWNEHLWKLAAECVIYIASPTNFSRFEASGEMVNNPRTLSIEGNGAGSETVGIKEMKWKMDKLLMDRIDPMIASLKEYLCDYSHLYSLYNCRDCGKQQRDGVSYERKSAWINVYDRKRHRGCRDDS